MSILEDIQAAAVDGATDLGTLLRKCKVLGARLGSEPLENWLLWESNGYPADVPVPGYRIWALQLKGHFSGPFQSMMKNVPIPLVGIPEKTQKLYQDYECRQSVASIEIALKSSEANLQVSTGDLAVALGTSVYENYNCIQAWAEFGSGQLVELLNAVRNRILDLVLALWKESPTAGESASPGTIAPSQVSQIFNTTVFGGSANLIAAHGSSVTINVYKDDFGSLADALSRYGVSAADVAELRNAVATDVPPKSKNGFGPNASGWISKMLAKAADGSWNVGIAVGAEIIYHALAKYYGLG